jgi:hypothetical protein
VVEALGLIFAYLGDGEPPPPPNVPEWEQPGALRVLPPEVWPCPFFDRIENSCDIAHVGEAHRRSGLGEVMDRPWTTAIERTRAGLRVSIESEADLPPVLFEMPNLLRFHTPIANEVGWREHRVWRVPIDDRSCVTFSVAFLPASIGNPERFCRVQPLERPFDPTRVAHQGAAVLAGELPWERVDRSHLTEVEDYVALCGLPDPRSRVERLTETDAPIRELRRLWLEAAGGFEEQAG